MKKFTAYQKEEILALLEIRRETVEDDIESATPLEAIPGALDLLEKKIEADDMNFTDLEREWIIEECEWRQQVAYDNEGNEGIKVYALANSMQNAMDKIIKP